MMKMMPSKGGGFDIMRADTGKMLGHSATKEQAFASIREMYANMSDEDMEAEMMAKPMATPDDELHTKMAGRGGRSRRGGGGGGGMGGM